MGISRTPVKIAVSGAVSTGKTTLGKALAGELGVAFIAENLESLFYIEREKMADPAKHAKLFLKCLESKRQLELLQESFVVDRCPVDILNFWFAKHLHSRTDTQPIYERCRRDMLLYDRIVLLPFGVLPFEKNSEDGDPKRNAETWFRLHGSARITGLAHHFLEPDKIIHMPKNIVELDARINFVRSALDR